MAFKQTANFDSKRRNRYHNNPNHKHHFASAHHHHHHHANRENIPSELVKKLFEKRFKYEKNPDWKLPAIENWFPDVSVPNGGTKRLQELKEILNTEKGKLNDYQIEPWHTHTTKRNPAGDVVFHIKNTIKAEFVTQAWCKFYECLNQYPLVKGPRLNSLHLCEAPGAFITALNHYLYSNYEGNSIEWNWLSSSLNPYYEGNHQGNMLVDDRLIFYTFDKWMFGTDFTGNIMNVENIHYFIQRAKNVGDIDLITADGSIDCMENPDSQELIVSRLHYAEICGALGCLSNGGSFVLKMFTLFEASTVCLMYLLNCVFKEVNVFKPATSKGGNSEVYVICLEYEKDSLDNFDTIYKLLLDKLEIYNCNSDEENILFQRKCLPEDFIRQHEKCAAFFTYEQMSVIESNIYHYEKPTEMDMNLRIKKSVFDYYMNLYKIKRIPIQNTLLHSKKIAVKYQSFQQRVYTGSFTERSSLHSMKEEEKLNFLNERLSRISQSISWPYLNAIVNLGIDKVKIPLKIYKGKSIEKVYSSLFVNLHLIHLRNKIASLQNEMDPFKIKYTYSLFSSSEEENLPIISCSTENGDEKTDDDDDEDQFTDERNFFKALIKRISSNRIEKITIKNFLILSHFSVSILRYLWSNVYEQLILDTEHNIILKNLQESDEYNYKIALDKLKSTLFDEGNDCNRILCLIDIKYLHKNDFSDAVINYNNELLITTYEMLLNNNRIN